MNRTTGDDQGAVLLTGGTGFLGSHLLIRLVRDGRKVLLLKRTISNTKRVNAVMKSIIPYDIDVVPLEKPFQEHRIDLVIHCAAEQTKHSVDPESFLKTNVLFPISLLQHGKRYGIRAYINTDTVLDKNVNAYALSKHQFNEWFNSYADDMACINLATELFYGPHDRETSFVSYVIRELLRNTDTIDLTKGEQERDFVYIEDVVDAFIHLIDHSKLLKPGYYEYQIGTGNALPIRNIVTLMKSLTGNRKTYLNFGALPYRKHEIMDSRIDISGLTELGWKPRFSLEDGLKTTIDAIRTQMEIN